MDKLGQGIGTAGIWISLAYMSNNFGSEMLWLSLMAVVATVGMWFFS
jgi:hypothetical protein